MEVSLIWQTKTRKTILLNQTKTQIKIQKTTITIQKNVTNKKCEKELGKNPSSCQTVDKV